MKQQMMAQNIFYNLRRICLLLFLLVPALRSVAALEPYQHVLRGAIKKGDVLTVKDEKFQNPAYDWSRINNLSVENLITFGLFRDSSYTFKKSFSCELTLKVEYWTQPDQQQPITLDDIKLKVNYDTTYGASYQAEAVYHFKNAHRYKITVKDISSAELGDKIPPVFTLNAQIFIDRKYLPDDKAKPEPMTVTTSGTTVGLAGRGMGTMDAGEPDWSVTVGWGVAPARMSTTWSGLLLMKPL
ncbi:hypothetical protein MKQ70_14965 [Chitinophaga sedimenti]|uniref:hypothetical protein n=1 Tax=Chitinophaga sedimenti TaxID=2033606 RepID=UPI00200652B7|nr:hypothetical protein [Chitinophaga sedimenti]MCK7556245.1 hypothetical protein [Chitinophaga sedimenti]